MADIAVEMGHTICWCGVPFSLPKRLLDSAVNSKHTIYCPAGHTLTWKETEVDRLRQERDRAKQQIARAEDEAREARARADKAEAATKRLKKRTATGTCPCCQRTFSNMSTHMRTQHPTFVAEQVNVVPLKRAQQS